MSLFYRLRGPRFDGQSLHFSAEWSEDADEWEQVFVSGFTVPGWVNAEGRAVFDPEQLEAAIERAEAEVDAYLESKRNPPTMPVELADVMRRPMTRATLSEQIQAARQIREAGPARGTVD